MRAFNQVQFYDFEERIYQDIVNEIQSKGKDYLLRVDESEFKTYLYEKFSLAPLSIDYTSELIGPPSVSKEVVQNEVSGREGYQVEVYTFIVQYNFQGDANLFKVQPSARTLASYDIVVNEQIGSVSYSFKMHKQDPQEFNRLKRQAQTSAFCNLENVNQNVQYLNDNLPKVVARELQKAKDKYIKENDFFAAINIKVNQDTQSVFTAPTIKKKIIPQPKPQNTKEFSSEPMMSSEMFRDILRVVYDSGKNMEKKPALYKDKDEEGLRDQFLFVLETRYEGTTASGETFNRCGKTDILLRYAADSSNLFVAECKFWHGASEFGAAISQLFDRYLTWRDSKAALLMFVRNKDFSSVLNTIEEEAKKHSCFKKAVGKRGESSFSYLFCLPQDINKIVHFEIMAFHYDR